MTRPRATRLLLAGALLAAAAAPNMTQADALTTSVVSGNAPGPSSTFTEVTATADCGARLVAGGGTRLAQSTPVVTHNGIHIEGSFPDGPTRWVAAGGSGGGIPNDAQTLAYAVCLTGGPAATQVVAAGAPGPSLTFQAIAVTATCPAGTRLLSGGARTTPATIGSLKPSGSYPSDAAGTPLLAGTNPSSWTVTGLNGGGGDRGNTTYAFAVCTVGVPLPDVVVAHARVAGPALASTPAQATVACPPATTLLGGGGFISDAFGLPGSQGDHLTGSYPSDAAGTPDASGPAGAWTAASHTGGVDSGAHTQTDVWAMCARAPADIAGDLRRQIAPPARTTAAGLVRRPVILPFTALLAGRVSVSWYLGASLVARGSRSVSGPAATTVAVRVTAGGRRLLARPARRRLIARGTFAAPGRRVVAATRAFVLAR